MQTAICLLPVVPVRKEPSHRSEMVSQVLFGEWVQTGEEKDDFLFVRCAYDGYEGWVQANQVTPFTDGAPLHTEVYTASFVTPVTRNKTLLYVPYGSPVYQHEGGGFSAGESDFRYLMQDRQTWKPAELRLSATTLSALYQPYLNVPYLWGGKSVFGTDCSGFVQQVFKLLGVKLLRDAFQQAGQGQAVGSLSETRLGDLAFFQNESSRVTHVGIVLDDGTIVHASGQVRIDALTQNGIVRADTGRLTHALHSIRRFLPE